MKEYLDVVSTSFKPSTTLLLIEPVAIKDEIESESGLMLEVDRKKTILTRPNAGKVVSASDENTDLLHATVFFPSTDGIDLVLTDGEFLLIKNTSILGIKTEV